MLGAFFFYLNKMKTKRLSNHLSQYFIHNRKIGHNKCLNREMLHFYALNELISNWCLLQVSKKLAQGQKRAKKTNYGCRVLRVKEDEKLPACHQRLFKSQHLWRNGGAYVHTVWAACMFWKALWMVYKGFRATYAPLQMMSISGKALCISAGQCKNTYYSYYNSMTL